MTSKEKKETKFKLAEAKKQQKVALRGVSGSPAEDFAQVQDQHATKGQDRYLQLDVNASTLEQELADLRGERDGVPPVVLSQAMAEQAIRRRVVDTQDSAHVDSSTVTPLVLIDDALGAEWAAALQVSMMPAEETRREESMRLMPYRVVPEVWIRLRPTVTESCDSENVEASPKSTFSDERAWAFCQMRPANPSDTGMAAVAQALSEGTNLHLSCGAKFGCDLLLYDGPRHERHAFAGLRVVRSDDGDDKTLQFPLPTAYNMAGYVRCLNTAGKLALLGTVVKDSTSGILLRVAIVDLALEKVQIASSKRSSRKKTIADRKRTLAKT
jgi:hypothetical protein